MWFPRRAQGIGRAERGGTTATLERLSRAKDGNTSVTMSLEYTESPAYSPSSSGDKTGHAMTRNCVAKALQRRLGLSTAESFDYVDQVLAEIMDAVASGDEVKLRAFGSFRVRSKRERPGRNPKTGVSVPVSARRVVTFKPSRVLCHLVNKSTGRSEAECETND